MRFGELSGKDLEVLRQEITEYYQTYYAELRSRLQDHELAIPSRAVPEHLKGYRRVVTVMGRDGLVVTHWPNAWGDEFEFHLSPEKPVRELVAEECAGERVLDYAPGTDFGIREMTEPLRLVMEGREVWRAPWTRLEVSSRLDAWRDMGRARRAALEDLVRYVGLSEELLSEGRA
ncbi:hypothetical protein Rxycam_02977 [Rubrobacter xylanophilus DSM 9941]|uniref:hypothetical protein n=1 Tax=Rubrobacter xylanophilus TaxID=49319 RepID=UPI001C63EE8C|nr:hypothetical protein [Rubrobacter xylanophilus]QYJ17138.1 hypothetical protein Rxycam_02977 [Rubrobacter xylanophilus DSM 9941]